MSPTHTERQKLDEGEAKIQLENRKRIIARANRLLYDEYFCPG